MGWVYSDFYLGLILQTILEKYNIWIHEVKFEIIKGQMSGPDFVANNSKTMVLILDGHSEIGAQEQS